MTASDRDICQRYWERPTGLYGCLSAYMRILFAPSAMRTVRTLAICAVATWFVWHLSKTHTLEDMHKGFDKGYPHTSVGDHTRHAVVELPALVALYSHSGSPSSSSWHADGDIACFDPTRFSSTRAETFGPPPTAAAPSSSKHEAHEARFDAVAVRVRVLSQEGSACRTDDCIETGRAEAS
mmetsp:Transcript_5944/g.15112  ORF Transcript_5944/g.15112 Transcript_5944/m.15112 type:complete len:181 (+) Transcript_5944:45-587(+)